MDGGPQRIEGVMIARLVGLEDGRVLVAVAGGVSPARSLVPLDGSLIGAEVAVLFEDGDPARPLVLGRLLEAAGPEVLRDGERVRVTAAERIELRVGKASIVMEKDGRITIRGSYVTSHASAANRIRGGSVNLN
ncbi:MAG: DUF6484 domain-containing protein [Amaricoccus sp.]